VLCLGGHVRGDVDCLGQLRDRDLEARLHVLEDLGVVVGRRKRDREALGAEAARTADAAKEEEQRVRSPRAKCEGGASKKVCLEGATGDRPEGRGAGKW